MGLRVARRLGFIALIASLIASPALAGELRVGGTGAVNELLRQLAPAFKAETGHALAVVPNLGTSGAYAAAMEGKIGVAVGGREPRGREIERGLKAALSFRTPFALAAARPGPEELKSAELARLYAAARPLWPDGKPIVIILRPPDDTDNQVLAELAPGMAEALQTLRKRRDIPLASTDQVNADLAEATAGALTGMTLTQLLTEKRNLRPVTLDGVAPTLANYRAGTWRVGKTLHVVVVTPAGPEAQAFVTFLAGPTATAILETAALTAAVDGK